MAICNCLYFQDEWQELGPNAQTYKQQTHI